MLWCPNCKAPISNCSTCGQPLVYDESVKAPTGQRPCRWCGYLFGPVRSNEVYCCTGHRAAHAAYRKRQRRARRGLCARCEAPLTEDEIEAHYLYCAACRAVRLTTRARRKRLKTVLDRFTDALLVTGPLPHVRGLQEKRRRRQRIDEALRVARRAQFLSQVYYVAPTRYRTRRVPLELREGKRDA